MRSLPTPRSRRRQLEPALPFSVVDHHMVTVVGHDPGRTGTDSARRARHESNSTPLHTTLFDHDTPFPQRCTSELEPLSWFEMRSANEPERPKQVSRTSPDSAIGAVELLGQRWILRVIWELEPGPLGFLELRRRMGNCSSSMLSERLQRLQHHGIVEKRADKAYELTFAGTELGVALQGLWDWSERWSTTVFPARTSG